MITDEHLKQIGRVVVNFQSLEVRLSFVLWALISDNQKLAQAVTAGLSFSNLSNMFTSVCAVKLDYEPQLKQCQEIIAKINDLNARRNDIIHSSYGISEDDGKVSALRSKSKGFKGMEHSSKEFKPELVKKLASDIKQCADDLMLIFYPKENN